MLRDLAELLEDLHDGITGVAVRAARARQARDAVRVSQVKMSLPIDVIAVFKAGGCALLADEQRAHADAPWRDVPSRLHIVWEQTPTIGGLP